VKNYPLLKEEHEQEQFQKQGRKQVGNSFTNKSANISAKKLSKVMLAAWVTKLRMMKPLRKKKLL